MKNIKEYFTYIFLIALLIGAFIWGHSCNGNKVIEPTTKETTTVYKDTIFPPDIVINLPTKLVPYPVYVKDTTGLKPQPIDSLELYRFFVYRDSTEDNNVKIYSKIVTQGRTLNSFKPSYKLKVPLIIKDSTVVKQDSLIYKPYKYELHTNILATPKMLAPMLELSINKWSYSAGYDPFNKLPVVQIKYRIKGWTPKRK